MSNYDHDQDPYDHDDDERFYEETVYNEEYYIEREQDLIRQSNLELELEELDQLETTQTVPLTQWEDGSIRISGSRVPLSSVIYHFELGSTPEQIAYKFQGLHTADIYAVRSWQMSFESRMTIGHLAGSATPTLPKRGTCATPRSRSRPYPGCSGTSGARPRHRGDHWVERAASFGASVILFGCCC